MERLYAIAKRYHLKWKASILERYMSVPATVLDIGAGTGDFVNVLKSRGYEAIGFEPEQTARENAKTKGLELYADTDLLADRRFDVITLWHVLEHMPDW